jgi:hypothetical protein
MTTHILTAIGVVGSAMIVVTIFLSWLGTGI